MTKDTSGPAFPRNYAYQNPEAGISELKSVPGMTLRQYAAIHVVSGLLAGAKPPEINGKKMTYDVGAVIIADALLAELAKTEEK